MANSDCIQLGGSSFGVIDGQGGRHNKTKRKPWRSKMITKSLIAAAAVAASLTALAPVQQAQAKVNVDINLGLGGGFYPGYGYGGGYGGGYYPVIDPYYGGGISCHKGKNIVKWSGFHNVNAFDCSAPVYQYMAWKFGHKYKVKVSMGGNIIGVKKIF
jgi:hypothetical protein